MISFDWCHSSSSRQSNADPETKLDKGNPNEALTDRWAAAGSFKFPPHHPQRQQRVTCEHSQAEHKTQRIKLPHMLSIFYQLNIRNKHQGVFQKSFSIIPIIQSKDWWRKSLRKNCWSQRVWHHTRFLPPHCTVPLTATAITATVCLSLQLVSPVVCFKQPFIIFIFFIFFIIFSWKLCLTFVFAEFVLQTSQKVKLKSLQSFSHSE